MSNTYKIGQLELAYCRATYNKAYGNERAVEIGLGEYFLNKFGNNVVEVGSVMLYYGWDSHIIVDLTDLHPKVHRVNALDCDYKDFDVLSISTVEHLFKREYNNGSDEDSINLIKMITNQSKNYLITFPIGYNEFLDSYMKSVDLPYVVLKRINKNNEWIQDDNKSNFNTLFGHRDGRYPDGVWNNANALIVLSNLPEIINLR